MVDVSKVLNSGLVRLKGQAKSARLDQAVVTEVLEPGGRVDRGLRQASEPDQAVVGEGGRREGFGDRAKNLCWQSEAGAVQGDNIFIERATNLESSLELPGMYVALPNSKSKV